MIEEQILKMLTEDSTIEDKKQQIARAKAYIEANPDDPDNSELYELIDKLEKEINNIDDIPTVDLNDCLDKARDIVRSIIPESLVINLSDENRPTIAWANIEGRTLGNCSWEAGHPIINISNYLRGADEKIVMNTVIHELLHALPICRYSGHTGNWRALARLVSSKTDYNIDTYADDENSDAYFSNRSVGRSYYLVTCKNCGRKSVYYKRARIVNDSSTFSCRKCGAKDNYHIEYHPANGGVQIIKEGENMIDTMPNYNLSIPGYKILYHNTNDQAVFSIAVQGLKADAGKAVGRGKDGDYVWATSEPNLKGYGGNTVAFKIPEDEADQYKVNNTEYMIPHDIPYEDIIFIDRPIFQEIRLSDLPDVVSKFGKEKTINVLSNHADQLRSLPLDNIIDIINKLDESELNIMDAKYLFEENVQDDKLYPYRPGEKEAMDALRSFEQREVKNAVEKEFPGSTLGWWVGGSPMYFKSTVPVITDEANVPKIIKLLAELFQVDKSKVKWSGADLTKIKRPDLDKHPNNEYTPYRTTRRLLFDVDWEDTTNESLLLYKNYLLNMMKSQDIDWQASVDEEKMDESEQLDEGINKPVQDRISNFILDTFMDRRYGNEKFTDIADIEVGPDYIDIAFDFDFKEIETFNGLSGKPSKVIHPTPTEIEVTEKHIDDFMCNRFPDLFFKYYKVTPFFRIVKDEHRWLDDNALACMYDIVQFTERK